MVMEAGVAATAIEVMVKGADVTVIGAEPETFVYPAWAELAMQDPGSRTGRREDSSRT